MSDSRRQCLCQGCEQRWRDRQYSYLTLARDTATTDESPQGLDEFQNTLTEREEQLYLSTHERKLFFPYRAETLQKMVDDSPDGMLPEKVRAQLKANMEKEYDRVLGRHRKRKKKN